MSELLRPSVLISAVEAIIHSKKITHHRRNLCLLGADRQSNIISCLYCFDKNCAKVDTELTTCSSQVCSLLAWCSFPFRFCWGSNSKYGHALTNKAIAFSCKLRNRYIDVSASTSLRVCIFCLTQTRRHLILYANICDNVTLSSQGQVK